MRHNLIAICLVIAFDERHDRTEKKPPVMVLFANCNASHAKGGGTFAPSLVTQWIGAPPMKRLLVSALCLMIIDPSSLALYKVRDGSSQAKSNATSKYDPKRDPEKDIQDAVAEAQRTGKRILLEVGGEWCSWCHIMDRYFEQNPKLLDFREQNFVLVKINVSQENENKKLLSRYPKITGYPHIFVLDTDGKLLHSQDTSRLESGRSYNLEKFFSFLKNWARP